MSRAANRSWSAARAVRLSAIFSLVVGGAGFILMMCLNAFVLDEFDAYGEVPIPGSGQVELPAGDVKISFHTLMVGSSNGFVLPPLKLSIIPPDGAPDPVLTENHSATTSVNGDTHVRVWDAQVPTAGTYQIRTDGPMGGYVHPQLAFGHDTQYDWLTGVAAAVFGLGMVELFLSFYLARLQRPQVPPGSGLPAPIDLSDPAAEPAAVWEPSDQGVRLQQLKTITALRDSGALTPDEFEAEKRRILDS